MIMNAGAAGAAGAAAAARARAIKASGVILHVEPEDFLGILKRQPAAALVAHATGGLFSTKHTYLTSYKGLAFFTRAPAPLDLPAATEMVEVKKIWMP